MRFSVFWNALPQEALPAHGRVHRLPSNTRTAPRLASDGRRGFFGDRAPACETRGAMARSLVTSLRIGLRVVGDVARYRLRKREAGNLATSVTLAVGLGLPLRDVAARAVFAAVLNLFVYLVNDCFDVRIDLAAPGRDTAHTRYLADHLDVAWGACAALAALLLAGGAWHSRGLFAAAAVNAAVIVAYSGWLKHRAIGDLAAMAVWGVSMAMAGFPLDDARGWRMAALLGLLSTVTEAVQVLRDEPSDRAANVRTTAVVLGPATTAWLARGVTVLAAVYAAVWIHPAGAVIALGALVELSPSSATRSWDRLRVLFGVTWLVLVATLRLRG